MLKQYNLTLFNQIPNLYWEGFHHLNYRQSPFPILSHIDCLIHQLLVMMEQHFIFLIVGFDEITFSSLLVSYNEVTICL